MFAVIYKSYIKPGMEEEFHRAWKLIATYFHEKRGALGSTIHRSEQGYYVTYSRWPDKMTRDASWPKEGEAFSGEIPKEIQEAGLSLKMCLDPKEKFPEVCMEVIDQL